MLVLDQQTAHILSCLCQNGDHQGNEYNAQNEWDNVITTATPKHEVVVQRPYVTTTPKPPLRATEKTTTEAALTTNEEEEEDYGDSGDGNMNEDTTTMVYTSAPDEISGFLKGFLSEIEKTVPIRLLLVIGGGIVGVIVLCCIIFIARHSRKKPKEKRRKRKARKGARPHESASAKSSTASSASAPVPKKMEAEKINMMEFSHKGALVMQDVKGEVKHALDDVKSGEIVRVQYDTGQNEIVTIGSDVDIIKVSNFESASKRCDSCKLLR
ncbi:unnamed protein product [Cylicostephanus goldi]|uniref:Uncharacterized protein n=1 Tax=Cylicostephanus goldi TaxID=71465 RepID=A0A3P6SZY6_CYLGO|nr:unnamed protein product [Cylicostephanus goldi]